MTLINWRGVGKPEGERPVIAVSRAPGIHALSVPTAAAPQGSLYALGRSLFGDYLFAVEIAGTVLLVATVGAIVMAPRRRKGIYDPEFSIPFWRWGPCCLCSAPLGLSPAAI